MSAVQVECGLAPHVIPDHTLVKTCVLSRGFKPSERPWMLSGEGFHVFLHQTRDTEYQKARAIQYKEALAGVDLSGLREATEALRTDASFGQPYRKTKSRSLQHCTRSNRMFLKTMLRRALREADYRRAVSSQAISNAGHRRAAILSDSWMNLDSSASCMKAPRSSSFPWILRSASSETSPAFYLSTSGRSLVGQLFFSQTQSTDGKFSCVAF